MPTLLLEGRTVRLLVAFELACIAEGETVGEADAELLLETDRKLIVATGAPEMALEQLKVGITLHGTDEEGAVVGLDGSDVLDASLMVVREMFDTEGAKDEVVNEALKLADSGIVADGLLAGVKVGRD